MMIEISPPNEELIDVNVWVGTRRGNLLVGDIRYYWQTISGLQESVLPRENVFYFFHGKWIFILSAMYSDIILLQVVTSWSMGNASPSFMVTAAIAERLVISVTRVPRLFGLEYRLATSAPLPVANPFPAALLGVLAGDYCPIYELHFAPENIIVVGDSGGGILAYQLARYCTSFGEPERTTTLKKMIQWVVARLAL
uniref:Putative alpha/beta-hydrolase n=1 Tax=Moniliophthora roreri TaxID=221103 RepID=A0A0W0ETH0_MONRR